MCLLVSEDLAGTTEKLDLEPKYVPEGLELFYLLHNSTDVEEILAAEGGHDTCADRSVGTFSKTGSGIRLSAVFGSVLLPDLPATFQLGASQSKRRTSLLFRLSHCRFSSAALACFTSHDESPTSGFTLQVLRALRGPGEDASAPPEGLLLLLLLRYGRLL